MVPSPPSRRGRSGRSLFPIPRPQSTRPLWVVAHRLPPHLETCASIQRVQSPLAYSKPRKSHLAHFPMGQCHLAITMCREGPLVCLTTAQSPLAIAAPRESPVASLQMVQGHLVFVKN